MKKINDLISVIVPIYNVADRVSFCIDSILKQTYNNLEIILVDDGSTDGSSLIIDKYANNDERIKVFHKKNDGVSNARNFGMTKSNGNFISFIDADDSIECNYFEVLIAYQKKYNSDIVRCGYQFCDKVKQVTTKIKNYNDYYSNDNYIFDDMIKNYSFNPVWGELIKRKLLNNIKFDETLSMAEDFEFNINIIKNAKVVTLIPEVLYNYYYNINGMNYNKNKDKILKKIFDINKIYSNLLNDSFFNISLIQIRYINEIFPHILQIASYQYKDYLKEIKMIRNDSFLLFENNSNNNLKKAKYYLFYKILKKKYYNLLFIIGRLTLFIKKFKNYIKL